MTDPINARSLPGIGRYYQHPKTGELWPSVTNVIGTGVNKPTLVPWAAKVTAEAAARQAPRLAAAMRHRPCRARRPADRCGVCTDCIVREIKGEHKVLKEQAAGLGSRIHALTEAAVLGKPGPDDPEAEPFVEQALQFYSDFGVDIEHDVEAAEATVINRTAGYAGTLDVLVWLDMGDGRQLTVLDYKTSTTRPADSVYPEYGLQVAALAAAEQVLLPDGSEEPLPRPRQTAILNLRADRYALMPMPTHGTLDGAYQAFLGCLATTRWMHADRDAEKPVPTQPPSHQSRKAV